MWFQCFSSLTLSPYLHNLHGKCLELVQIYLKISILATSLGRWDHIQPTCMLGIHPKWLFYVEISFS